MSSLLRVMLLLFALGVFSSESFKSVSKIEAAKQQANFNLTTATLSQPRVFVVATSSGDLVFFGGGYNGTGVSNRVDICNVTSGSWSTATLSVPREQLAAASLGNLVFFAGGFDDNLTYYNQIDIYNVSDGSWSTATLSVARANLAATSLGNLVFFCRRLQLIFLQCLDWVCLVYN
jgi:hypothetical protein